MEQIKQIYCNYRIKTLHWEKKLARNKNIEKSLQTTVAWFASLKLFICIFEINPEYKLAIISVPLVVKLSKGKNEC